VKRKAAVADAMLMENHEVVDRFGLKRSEALKCQSGQKLTGWLFVTRSRNAGNGGEGFALALELKSDLYVFVLVRFGGEEQGNSGDANVGDRGFDELAAAHSIGSETEQNRKRTLDSKGGTPIVELADQRNIMRLYERRASVLDLGAYSVKLIFTRAATIGEDGSIADVSVFGATNREARAADRFDRQEFFTFLNCNIDKRIDFRKVPLNDGLAFCLRLLHERFKKIHDTLSSTESTLPKQTSLTSVGGLVRCKLLSSKSPVFFVIGS
jgi:hypothetical protein